MYYKKSEPHKAAVVGDTVGDPFKDTSGPSMNILIKLSCLVGLTLSPMLNENGAHGVASNVTLTSSNDSMSYALGVVFADNFKQMEIDSTLNPEVFMSGILAHFGDQAQMEMRDAKKFLDEYFRQRELAKVQPLMEKEQKFLEQNKAKAGVLTTTSGLQYEIIQEGTGATAATDEVEVIYDGTLTDGTPFDSSKGKSVTFKLNEVIPGWAEGLTLVKEGGKIKLYVPSDLAYGDYEQPGIPAYSTLIFDVTVVKVIKK